MLRIIRQNLQNKIILQKLQHLNSIYPFIYILKWRASIINKINIIINILTPIIAIFKGSLTDFPKIKLFNVAVISFTNIIDNININKDVAYKIHIYVLFIFYSFFPPYCGDWVIVFPTLALFSCSLIEDFILS